MDHYEEFHNLMDLESWVKNDEMACRLSSDRDPELPDRLHSLAISHKTRYKNLGNLAELEAASHQWAIRMASERHPEMSAHLHSLAASGIKLTPEGDQNLPKYLRSLAESYKTKYKVLGYLADLQSRLENEKAAISLTSEENPDLAGHLWSVAICYTDGYKRSDNLSDLNLALDNLQRGVQLTSDKDSNLPI
ncbi:hypothetical protein C8J57DRAFT_1576751 [Mycena rebaudengoi]|nr:hypothetical protein C8J57DRAFT_1576751 [Mycena rebaudengoi]